MANKLAKRKTGYKHLTEAEFNNIKQLLALVSSKAKVADLTQRSIGTVHAINSCNTWKDYRAYTTAHTANINRKTTNSTPADAAHTHTGHEHCFTAADRQLLLRLSEKLDRLPALWDIPKTDAQPVQRRSLFSGRR